MGRGTFAAGLIAFAVFLAGCGGGSDSTTSSVTEAQFTKQADAICAKGMKGKEAAIANAFESAAGSEKYASQSAQEVLIINVLLPPLQEAADELEELEAPSGDEDEIEAMVGALQSGLALGKKEPSVAIINEERMFGKSNQLAAKYGLKVCSEIR